MGREGRLPRRQSAGGSAADVLREGVERGAGKSEDYERRGTDGGEDEDHASAGIEPVQLGFETVEGSAERVWRRGCEVRTRGGLHRGGDVREDDIDTEAACGDRSGRGDAIERKETSRSFVSLRMT